jgi:ubiquinone/menaquinone biosynthesis C-methylase UbiE/uncharacterized OsmC-like protein
MKSVTVSLVPGCKYQHRITNGTNSATTDVDIASGGNGGGLDPKELALGALGGCIAMTVIMVAGRRKWDLKRLTVTVTQTEETDPADAAKKRLVVTEALEVEGNLSAQELDDIKATASKCPVYKLMTEPKRMETTVKHVVPVTPEPVSATIVSNATDQAGGQMPTKEETARQFGRTAHAYATSAGHATGSDLVILLSLLDPKSNMVVLDIATGAGHTAMAVAPYVREVMATDLTPEMIAETQRLSSEKGIKNLRTQVADAEALPFADASFDAVTVRIAPHHFPNIQKAIGEVARVLRPGGVFIVEDSCAPEARRQDKFINDLEKLRDPTHVRSYTRREWKAMLAQAGLAVVRVRNYRKQHDVADWVQRSDLSAADQAKVFAAFTAAPEYARKQFSITYDGERALTYSDDKVILRAVKS